MTAVMIGVSHRNGVHLRWTPEEDDRLRTAWETGALVKLIAQRFGRSEDSVACRVRRLGIEPRMSRSPAKTAEAKAALDREIVRLYADGLPIVEMARLVGMGETQVKARISVMLGRGMMQRRKKPMTVAPRAPEPEPRKPLAPVRLADHRDAFIAASRHERSEEGVRMLAAMIVAGIVKMEAAE